ncbi:hypothetical protein GGR56DRAFT_641047 [Xylariaceae sp. FL0804]|nr:hypothetical protein GGR56DRAFT_641047 [Xylariaceae sp. FL0804]
MLLTSSQVSVLLTSGIVVLCTAALFFSGYAIQQRTLRDLRAAIRPPAVSRPRPKPYHDGGAAAPQRHSVRLEDGRVLELVDYPAAAAAAGQDGGGGGGSGSDEDDENDLIVVVRPTEQDPEQPSPAAVDNANDYPGLDAGAGADDDSGRGGRGGGEREGDRDEDAPRWDGVQMEGEKPLSRLERRRLIKAEIQRLSQGEAPVYYQRRLW